MRRLAASLVIACLMGWAWAAESWQGIYLQGFKIGYSYTRDEAQPTGDVRSETYSLIQTAMLGSALNMQMRVNAERGADGALKAMSYRLESAGRELDVDAIVNEKEISVSGTIGGHEVREVVPIPAGAMVVDDPTQHLLRQKTGDSASVHVFDPNTLSLVKIEIALNGESPEGGAGSKLVTINDPRAPMTVHLKADGSLIRAVGPMGMELRPESRETATDLPTGDAAKVDFASASSIVPDKAITRVQSRSELVLDVTGVDLGRLPSDRHQQVAKQGEGWRIKITPVDPSMQEATYAIGEIRNEWLKPDVRVPSDDPALTAQAREVIGGEKDPIKAAEKLRQHVLREVRANAGIGVMRDAREVLESGEGVCRDHAVAMAALARSVGIPTRLVSGLVYAGDRFYYHAWVEIWTGKDWLGMDSTRANPRLTATHIKVSQGKVADAFLSFLVDGARIHVVEEVAAAQ